MKIRGLRQIFDMIMRDGRIEHVHPEYEATKPRTLWENPHRITPFIV